MQNAVKRYIVIIQSSTRFVTNINYGNSEIVRYIKD